MSKMNEELQKALAKVVSQAMVARVSAKEATLAAEEAQCAAEEAESLLRAAAILDKQPPLYFLDSEVELTCHEPELTWSGQTVEVDVYLDVCGQELTLEQHHVALETDDLDCLDPDYAVFCFTVLDMVKAIAEVLQDDASCDEEKTQHIAAITSELRRLAGL